MWEQYSKREQSSMWEHAGAVFQMDALFHMGAMFSVGLVCCVGARSIWYQCSMCGSSLFYTSSILNYKCFGAVSYVVVCVVFESYIDRVF
jgi:hypothetical protein